MFVSIVFECLHIDKNNERMVVVGAQKKNDDDGKMFKNKHNKCKRLYTTRLILYNFSPGAVKNFYNFLFIMKIKYIFVI